MYSPSSRSSWRRFEAEDGPDLKVKGNVVDHEYKIERDGDSVLVLAVTVDFLSHD